MSTKEEKAQQKIEMKAQERHLRTTTERQSISSNFSVTK